MSERVRVLTSLPGPRGGWTTARTRLASLAFAGLSAIAVAGMVAATPTGAASRTSTAPPESVDTPPAADTATTTTPDASEPEEAASRQIFVRPGNDIGRALAEAQPGDEVILWPGEFEGVSFEGLRGTPARPITIRGLRPENPPVLTGGAWGLRLIGPRHVRIAHLVIEAPRLDAIEIRPADGEDTCGPLEIRDIVVRDVGARPGCHGLHLRGVHDAVIEDVVVRGWTGAAVELVGCHRVEMLGLDAVGLDRGELIGVRFRHGSREILMRESRIAHAGRGGIVLGGRTSKRDPLPAPTDGGLRWQVEEPTIQQLLITDVDVAITFLGVARAALDDVTVARASRAFFRVARPDDTDLSGVLESVRIDRSAFVTADGDAADSVRLVEVAAGAATDGISLGENLWWRPGGFPADTPLPGTTTFPQLLDVDPRLSPSGTVTAPDAAGLGADPSQWLDDAGDEAVASARATGT